jgi:AFG3 family protein
MFVGVGPSRVRDLFKQARANAPCIIFIDEIDAVGRKRQKGGFSGGNDERESTLNQLLVEMDGFDPNSSIVVLAGTNRLDILDSALLRPGRFDRKITVENPDIKGRKAIFDVHLRDINLADKAETYSSRLAALTPGFSGADIANICNEAAILAARGNKTKVELVDFESATDRVIGGLASNKIMTPEERRIIAYHEAGHAIAGWNLEYADPLLKVTIVPRDSGALGFAQYLPKEIALRTREQILDIVCMALAGRAAEQVTFGKVTTGASDDLRKVTQIVYQMVQVYGMNDKVGQMSFPREEGAFGQSDRLYSEATAEVIDSEVRAIIDEAYARTLALVTEKKEQIRLVAELLLEKETITNMDITKLIGARPYSAGKAYEQYVENAWGAETSEVVKEDAAPSGATPLVA